MKFKFIKLILYLYGDVERNRVNFVNFLRFIKEVIYFTVRDLKPQYSVLYFIKVYNITSRILEQYI